MAVTNDSWYQYPNATDTEGLFQFFGYVNRTAEGLFFPAILIVVWMISFTGVFVSGGGGKPAAARAWTTSSLLCSILSILLVIMNFLAPLWMYITFVLVAIGVLWMKLDTPTIE